MYIQPYVLLIDNFPKLTKIWETLSGEKNCVYDLLCMKIANFLETYQGNLFAVIRNFLIVRI